MRPIADVCFWHKADIAAVVIDVRFRAQSGHGEFMSARPFGSAYFTRLLDFSDGYYARSRLLDYLNSNGFDWRSGWLLHPLLLS
jgi:hypothetical protein